MNSTYSLNPVVRIDKPNRSGLCPMYLRYTLKKKWKNIPLNKTIDPKYWNNNEYEPRKNCPNKTEIQHIIRNKKVEVEKYILNYYIETGEYPSSEELIKMISKKQKNKDWEHYFDLFVENQKKNKYVENTTLNVYQQTKEKLKNYLSENDLRWSWSGINIQFYQNFVYHLRNNGLKDGTIGKHIKTLKSFLNYISINYNLINPNQYRGFVTLKDEPDFVILTEHDIEVMKSHLNISSYLDTKKVNLNSSEQNILRIMIMLCWCGMNYGDMLDLKISDIFSDKELNSMNDEKTGNKNEEVLSIYFKKIRKKLKKIDKKLIPIIPITHEISDLLKLSFQGYDKIFKQVSQIYRERPFIQSENYSIMSFWGLIEYLKSDKHKGKETEILPTYPYFFKKINNVTFNKEIKIVLKKIGIDYDVKVVKVNSNNSVEEPIVQKCDVVSSRTGRRTYITNSLSKGVNLNIILRTTGIKKMETLRRYENITESTIVKELKNKNPKRQKIEKS